MTDCEDSKFLNVDPKSSEAFLAFGKRGLKVVVPGFQGELEGGLLIPFGKIGSGGMVTNLNLGPRCADGFAPSEFPPPFLQRQTLQENHPDEGVAHEYRRQNPVSQSSTHSNSPAPQHSPFNADRPSKASV